MLIPPVVYGAGSAARRRSRPSVAAAAGDMVVGLVLVGHSPELLAGLRAMVAQAAPNVPVALAGGTSTGTLGTSAPRVLQALREAVTASGGDGAVILLDLGSAALAVEIALEEATDEERRLTRLSDGPIVEGAVLAAVEAASGASVDAVRSVADRAALAPKLPAGPALPDGSAS